MIQHVMKNVRSFRSSRFALTKIGVGVAALGVVGVSLAVNPGISVGALSTPQPIPPIIVAGTLAPSAGASTTAPPTTSATTVATTVPTVATVVTTTKPATTIPSAPTTGTTPPRKPSDLRIISGALRPSATITMQANGFTAGESATLTLGSSSYVVAADSKGQATFRFRIPRTAKKIVVRISSASGPIRTATFVVAAR